MKFLIFVNIIFVTLISNAGAVSLPGLSTDIEKFMAVLSYPPIVQEIGTASISKVETKTIQQGKFFQITYKNWQRTGFQVCKLQASVRLSCAPCMRNSPNCPCSHIVNFDAKSISCVGP